MKRKIARHVPTTHVPYIQSKLTCIHKIKQKKDVAKSTSRVSVVKKSRLNNRLFNFVETSETGLKIYEEHAHKKLLQRVYFIP